MVTRRDQIEAAIEKTTKGKDRNYLPTEQGAGMTKAGREA
jgi:hypothetical protein